MEEGGDESPVVEGEEEVEDEETRSVERMSGNSDEAAEDVYVDLMDVAGEEEPEDGEDLGEHEERDYRAMPELDEYDPRLLDPNEYRPMDPEERARAERELERREYAEKYGRGAPFIDEDDEGEDYGTRRERRRARYRDEAEAAADAAADEDDPSRTLIYDDPEKSIYDDRLREKIKACFRRFILSFKPEGQGEAQDDSTLIFYLYELEKMAEFHMFSLHVNYTHISLGAPGLAEWINVKPGVTLPPLDEVVKELTIEKYADMYSENDTITVRLTHFPHVDEVRHLRTEMIGQLVKVHAVVTKRTAVFPRLQEVHLDCAKCGGSVGAFEQYVNVESQPRPGSCPECQSRGPFIVNRENTVYQNFQKCTIQESHGSVPPGRVPRSKEVLILGDLVDCVKPGDEVEVTGIYESVNDASVNARHGFPVFGTRILANCIQRKGDVRISELTREDEKAIEDFAKDPNCRDRLIASIAPSIYGHEHIKIAIAYAMFAGVRKVAAGRHNIRGDINVLILGDPGTAKSQFLKYVEKTFHRAVYTTGKGASAVGLTASVRRDHLTGEWTLEGGALVLADEGICLIDEFDKMSEQDRTSIHEAMEQQSISISKAGIVTTLQSRCSVIACANPIQGRYDSQLLFCENVELTDPILSRFDVLAVVKDEVDRLNDERLADFVVCSHIRSHPEHPDLSAVPLQRVTQSGKVAVEPVTQDFLRKYIMYARKKVTPRLSGVDNDKLSKFYAQIRKEAHASGGMPMTVRHIESLIRMAEANAKIHLRPYVNTHDVDCAVSVMLNSFIQSQKHSVAERLVRTFTRFITPDTDFVGLLDFLVIKLFKNAQSLQELLRRSEEGDDVFITLQELRKEAEAAELAPQLVDKYVQSDVFLDTYSLHSQEGSRVTKIMRKVAAA